MKINDKIFIHYKKLADNIAEEITRNHRHPIDILTICKNLNISIINDTSNIDNASLCLENNKISIKLGNKYFKDINSPFVRYILAHEVGHYFINYKLGARITKNDYWIFEELCDYFARSILLPNSLVYKNVISIGNNLQQLLNFTKYLSKNFKVTWITSVCKIKDINELILFLNFKYSTKKRQFIVNKSLLYNNKYLNSPLLLNNQIIYKLLSDNPDYILLKPDNQLFYLLSNKFPLIFSSKTSEVLVIFRPKNIAIMAINLAQQSHTH